MTTGNDKTRKPEKETTGKMIMQLSKSDMRTLVKSLQFSRRKLERDFRQNTAALNNTDDEAKAETLRHFLKGESRAIQKINDLTSRLNEHLGGRPEDGADAETPGDEKQPRGRAIFN